MTKIESDLITTDNTYIEYDENSISYNAPHDYVIKTKLTPIGEPIEEREICKIHFQQGGVNDVGLNGIFMEDLIAICINRLESFQSSDFRCRENACTITKLEESLMWLRKRTNNRQKRGVQGTYQK